MESMGTDLAAHFTVGAAVVYIIEWLKKSARFQWIDVNSTTVNRVVSAVVALVIALGVQATGNAEVGWTITIPPAQALVAAGWEWMQQFFTQQFIYDVAVAKNRLAPPPTGGDQ